MKQYHLRSFALAPLCASLLAGCALLGNDEPTLGAASPGNASVVGTIEPETRNHPIPNPSPELIRAVQQKLETIGLKPGPVDGAMGKNTIRAVRLFKVARRLPVTDDLTPAVVTELGL